MPQRTLWNAVSKAAVAPWNWVKPKVLIRGWWIPSLACQEWNVHELEFKYKQHNSIGLEIPYLGSYITPPEIEKGGRRHRCAYPKRRLCHEVLDPEPPMIGIQGCTSCEAAGRAALETARSELNQPRVG